MSSLLGVILCGGRSSRMGTDKALLPHPDGGTFLSHSIARLDSICDQVCIAGEFSSTSVIPILKDPVPHQGPVVGIVNAMGFAADQGHDACFVLPVDMPFLATEHMEVVRDAWAKHRTLCCVVSMPDQRLQPLVGVYPLSLVDSLEELARSDHRSLRRWLERQDFVPIRLPDSACRNINSPQDLAEPNQ